MMPPGKASEIIRFIISQDADKRLTTGGAKGIIMLE
jgi:hypothetical protein